MRQLRSARLYSTAKTPEVLPSSAEATTDTGAPALKPAAEKQRQMQAPNREGIWTRNQQKREVAMQGPRFEQMDMSVQVCFCSLSGAPLEQKVCT
jgi:hypothetical protein